MYVKIKGSTGTKNIIVGVLLPNQEDDVDEGLHKQVEAASHFQTPGPHGGLQ